MSALQDIGDVFGLHLGAQRPGVEVSASGCRGSCSLAGFEEFLRPAVVQALGNAFTAAELGDGHLATQAIKDDADFVLG